MAQQVNYIVSVTATGQARLHESCGSSGMYRVIRIFGPGEKVLSGVVQGDKVILTLASGSVRVYDTNGRFIQKL